MFLLNHTRNKKLLVYRGNSLKTGPTCQLFAALKVPPSPFHKVKKFLRGRAGRGELAVAASQAQELYPGSLTCALWAGAWRLCTVTVQLINITDVRHLPKLEPKPQAPPDAREIMLREKAKRPWKKRYRLRPTQLLRDPRTGNRGLLSSAQGHHPRSQCPRLVPAPEAMYTSSSTALALLATSVTSGPSSPSSPFSSSSHDSSFPFFPSLSSPGSTLRPNAPFRLGL